ncbi:Lipid A biosynthesis palmitoleoyltransferase [subsurface metagenome]
MASFKELFEFSLFQIAKAPLSILSRKLCLSLGQALGLAFYYLDKKHRLIALSNLKIAFGKELPPSELKRIARNSFMHFGKTLMDIIKLPQLGEEKINALINIEGEENLLKALREKKGVLPFSAHYGSWEIAMCFFTTKGKLSGVARALDNKLLEKELLKLRTSHGSHIIYKHQAAKKILRSLQAGEMVAFLIDQNVLRKQAVFVDFFGKKAATTPSLASFSLRTKSPLIPVFCYPTSFHAYHLKIFSPLSITLGGNYNQDVLKITQICTKIIEIQIRKNPDYWLWFHNRWKTRPEEEEA